MRLPPGRALGTVAAVTALVLVTVSACQVPDADAPADTPMDHAELTDPADAPLEPPTAFWANLSAHCGQAFPGGLTLEPPGDDMLQGDELLVVHFRVCTDEELQLPFHIEGLDGEWDRSRTWIFRWTDDGQIELRHDHRRPDGTEDEVTWYGAVSVGRGTATTQEFIRDAEGPERGWRIIIEPEERYTYGTIRDGEWTWRIDFDLSTPLDEPPPPAWGYEDGGGPLR